MKLKEKLNYYKVPKPLHRYVLGIMILYFIVGFGSGYIITNANNSEADWERYVEQYNAALEYIDDMRAQCSLRYPIAAIDNTTVNDIKAENGHNS